MWTAFAYPLAEPQLYAEPPIPILLVEISTPLPVRRHHRHPRAAVFDGPSDQLRQRH